MAITINKVGNIIELSGISEDWSWDTTFPGSINGIAVEYIAFTPGADGDVLSVKEASATGPNIFPPRAVKGQGPVDPVYVNGTIKPFLDYSDCTFSAGHSVVIKLKG